MAALSKSRGRDPLRCDPVRQVVGPADDPFVFGVPEIPGRGQRYGGGRDWQGRQELPEPPGIGAGAQDQKGQHGARHQCQRKLVEAVENMGRHEGQTRSPPRAPPAEMVR